VLYAIIATDHPDTSSARATARPAHIERLRTLQDQGRLVLAGPHPVTDSPDLQSSRGFSGSLIVAEFNDLQAAQTWANDDPYMQAGVFSQIIVKPFVQVLPA
jgi:hypothetical protein